MGIGLDIASSLLGSSAKTQIGDLVVDCCIVQQHTREASVTEHAVEAGYTISDHRETIPKEIQIEGKLSEVTLETGYPYETTVNAFKDLILGSDHITDAINILEKYMKDGDLISINTSRISYDDMTVVSLYFDWSTGDKGFVPFTLKAREVQIVDTSLLGMIETAVDTVQELEQTNQKTSKNSSTKQSASQQDAGKSSGSTTNSADSAKGGSTLHNLLF